MGPWRLCSLALAGGVALSAAGCVSPQADVAGTEQMLAAAGFRQEPASTPALQNQLLLMPALQLLQRPAANGTVEYVYADPEFCHCLWLGDARNYQAFNQLAYQQRLADEQVQAAEMASMPPPGWGLWGPPVIVEGHGHDHDHH